MFGSCSRTFLSLLFAFVLSASSVSGWGTDGHALVAGVAQTLLTDEARTFVRNHLPASAAGNMSQVASWADNILYPDTDPDYRNWTWSKSLHYVDTEDWVCHYDRERDCSWSTTRQCVDGAIQNYTTRLANASLDDTQRTQALQFLIHFVGDAHQPLHAGFQGDLGGNEVKGDFCAKSGNLHSLWDTGLLERRITEEFQSQPQLYLKYLLGQLNSTYAANVSAWAQCQTPDESRFLACSTAWIEEGAELNCQVVYIDEDGQRITKETGFHMCQKYYETRIRVVEQRLLQGGVRLATVLNQIAPAGQHHHKSSRLCFGSMYLALVILLQSILILLLLIALVLRRKPATTVVQAPIINEKPKYFLHP